jgi:hypothetical protein
MARIGSETAAIEGRGDIRYRYSERVEFRLARPNKRVCGGEAGDISHQYANPSYLETYYWGGIVMLQGGESGLGADDAELEWKGVLEGRSNIS